jgi:hemerythrin superfamily protein
MFSLKNLSPSVTDMIRFDHSHVVVTFHQYVVTKRASVKKALAETICDALEIHATLEEEVFYPAMRQLGLGRSVLAKSVPEHNEMRKVIAEIRAGDPNTPRYDQHVHELMRNVLHHVADEETVLLPEAERMLSKDRLNALGAQMSKRRMQLLALKAPRAARNTVAGFLSSTAAIAVGLAGGLFAARLVSKKSA